MVRPSTKGLHKGELCCRLLQTKLQALNRKGPLLRNTYTLAQPLYCMCVLLRVGFLNLSKILHEIRGNQRKLEEGGRSGFCENMHCFSLSACGRRPYDAPSAKSYYAHLH